MGVAGTAAAALVTGTPYELLPLGDSNTRGSVEYPTAYRVALQNLLLAGGYVMDFVGPLNDNASDDGDHAGFGGYRIDSIENEPPGLDAILGANPDGNPDVILLMIGTNDIFQNHDLNNAPSRLSTLIGHIFDREPGAYLLLSTIIRIDATEAGGDQSVWDARVDAYNAAMPGIVSSFTDAGRNISLVDNHAVVSLDEIFDGFHVTNEGYADMANVWYAGIQATTVPVPPAIFLFGGGLSFLVGVAGFRGRARRHNATAR
jgi:hypothetical protein